jgi:hypothetical protein
MAEERRQSPSTVDHSNVSTNETKTPIHAKKNDSPKDNPLYTEPQPKCYIGLGNNPEL